MYMTTVLCSELYFTAAYLSVRTEPLSDIGQTGGEKKNRKYDKKLLGGPPLGVQKANLFTASK